MTAYTSSLGLTAKDIQPKNVRMDSNPNNDNKIRASWVLHCAELDAKRLMSLPQETKFMLYDAIDEEVSDKWIELMKKHVSESVAAGAKFVIDPVGADRLEDAYCMNADDHLLEAGEYVALKMPEFIESLPAAIQKQMIAC